MRIEDAVEVFGGACAVDEEFVSAEPSDHIEVEHGVDVFDVDGWWRVVDEVACAEESDFFAAETDEDDASAVLRGVRAVVFFGEEFCCEDECGGAGGVVVCARVDGSDFACS